MKKTSLFWLAASLTTILALVAAAGCSLVLAPDTTAPAVASTVPADNSAGIAVTSAMTARFSEAMDQLTIMPIALSPKTGYDEDALHEGGIFKCQTGPHGC
jgi:hypothetical protein